MSTPNTAEKGISDKGRSLMQGMVWRMTHAEKHAALCEYIAQLELEARRLQVLEELASASRLDVMEHPEVGPLIVVADLGSFDTLTEAADAEILRRSNTGDTNG